MPRLPSNSASSSSSAGRRRPRKRLATAAGAAALVLLAYCPSSVHAAAGGGGGGLRGSGADESHRPQHELDDESQDESRDLLADAAAAIVDAVAVDEEEEEEEEVAMEEEETPSIILQEGRTLANRGGGSNKIVPIYHFTQSLLSTNFPSPLKYNSDQQLSSGVASYLNTHLDQTLNNAHVENLGLACTKFQYDGGSETRWWIECEGMATFDTDNIKEAVLNNAVRSAFQGEAKHQFLEKMYQNYEMVHEVNEFESARQSRQRDGIITRAAAAPIKKKKKKAMRKKKKTGQNKKKQNSSSSPIQSKIQQKSSPGGVVGGGYKSHNKNIHNVDGSGKNAFGYTSGNANKGDSRKTDVDGQGNIIVKVRDDGKRRD